MTDNIFDKSGFSVQGHIHIFDPSSGETIINKRNAIHYENMSIALAESLSNAGQGFVYEMAFGNGGTSVDPTGIITYLTPNSTGVNASLYNQTYIKVVDDQSANNTDPNRNKIEKYHRCSNLPNCKVKKGSVKLLRFTSGLQYFDIRSSNKKLTLL